MTNPRRFIAIPPESEGERLDRWLTKFVPGLSFTEAQRLLRKGEIRLDGKRTKGGARLCAGQELKLPPWLDKPSLEGVTFPELSLRPGEERALRQATVFEDAYLLALNKPAGWPVQGGSKVQRPLDKLVVSYANRRFKRPAFLLHRLDKETSGLLLFALDKEAAHQIQKAFRAGSVHKTYLALVKGVPKSQQGEINLPLGSIIRGGRERVEVVQDGGKSALTRFEHQEHHKGVSLIKLFPKTGRKHQLRVHMSHSGHAVLGDRKYGGSSAPRLMLHAWKLGFTHVSGERVEIVAEPPVDFLATAENAGLVSLLNSQN